MWLSTDPLQEKYPNISTYAYAALNPVKYVDPNGMDWVQRDVDGVTEYYYDREVRSQGDITKLYGKDSGVTHIPSGTSHQYNDKKGNSVDFQFWNDATSHNEYGAVTYGGGKLLDDNKIIRGENLTIFGTSDNSVDAKTLYKNLWGLMGKNSYIGPDNPLTYGNKYSYDFEPSNLSEIGAIAHDKAYDDLKLAGVPGVFGSTRGWKADLELASASNRACLVNVLSGNIVDAARSSAIAGSFGLIGTVKTFLHPITVLGDKARIGAAEAVMSSYTPPMPYKTF